MASTTTETIKQLNNARDIVLKDPAIYPQIVPGVLPIIAPSQPLELRRWGADFLAETFASPVVSAEEKQKMCIGILDTLKGYLSRKEELDEEEDVSVVKSAIQCAANIYPLVLRHTIAHAEDGETWRKMAGMKSSILKRMDGAAAGVRVCCINFVARVVLVQTPGLIADPRRPEQNEISLAIVPRDHTVLPYSNLEAEAVGLLDRLLGVLQDNIEDALIVTATLNSLSNLVNRRATISAKIVTTVLNFNSLKAASRGTTASGKDRIAVKSMTKVTRLFLLNVLKRNPNHTLAGRIQQHAERLKQSLETAFLSENSRKRPSPDEPIDGLDDHKRIRIGNEIDAGTASLQQQPRWPPSLPPGLVSAAQLFTLANDPRAAGFHVEVIPNQIVVQLVPPLLHSIDARRFEEALNVVRARVLEVQRRATIPAGFTEDDDDYDPVSMDFGGADSEQIANRIDQEMPGPLLQQETAISLPPQPPLSGDEIVQYGEAARERLFGALRRMDEKKKRNGVEREKGFNRIVSAGQDRDEWITLLARLATRPSLKLSDEETEVKEESEDLSLVKKGQGVDLPSRIRDTFHRYIMDDWRRRIDVAISWLNEEWYADRLLHTASDNERLPNYTPLTLSLLDALVPYLDTKDGRYLIRFLSEIPYLPPATFERIKKIALDPERVQLSAQTLLYLIMFRPPAREMAIQCAADMWRENSDAKAAAEKILGKWRPEVLKEGIEVKAEGQEEAAS